MLFPVSQLIEGREKPLCVSRTSSVHDALELMIRYDYSQLPVLSESGRLLGLISEQSITKSYYHTGGNVSLMQVNVDHCLEDARQISPERDIFEALDMLKNVYAIVVVEHDKLKAILTNYDTAYFFRDFSEGLILVEDIEISLRRLIENVFPTTQGLKTAFAKVFVPPQAEAAPGLAEIDRLTFGEILRVINKNWASFENVLGDQKMFISLMEPIREIRNQLAHFRGRLEVIQRDALLHARYWLAIRMPVQTKIEKQAEVITQAKPSQHDKIGLLNYLVKMSTKLDNPVMGFDEIEAINGEKLPDTAVDHQSWWVNDAQTNPQSDTWLRAGYRVKNVDFINKIVSFQKSKGALYQIFFMDLLNRFKVARPGLTGVKRVVLQNWIWIGNIKPGFSYYWSFTSRKTFLVDLYLEFGEKAENKRYYDLLLLHKDEIEQRLDFPLEWYRLDNRKGSRICFNMPGEVTDPAEKLEKLKVVVVERTLKFIDSLVPTIREITSSAL